MKNNKLLNLGVLFCLGITFTACTTTKHILKRTDKVKVFKASEVLKSYELNQKEYEYGMPSIALTFDSDYLLGFSFTEEKKDKVKNKYPIMPLPPGESLFSVETMSVNIDLCKHWKETSFRKTPLEEFAYGRNHASFGLKKYQLFMSLPKLQKKNLVPSDVNEQEDICIYIDREYSGHFGRFKDKSNKIHYKASEINAARVALEKLK